MLGKIAEIRRIPSPQPSPTVEGADCSRFHVAGGLKSNLDLQPLIAGRLKSKKQPAQPVFLAEPLIPTAPCPLSRGRELERGQQAVRLVFGAVRVFGKDCHDLEEYPLPTPPPRGREQVSADLNVTGRLKKNARNINSRNFSGSLYRKADGTNAASVFSDGL